MIKIVLLLFLFGKLCFANSINDNSDPYFKQLNKFHSNEYNNVNGNRSLSVDEIDKAEQKMQYDFAEVAKDVKLETAKEEKKIEEKISKKSIEEPSWFLSFLNSSDPSLPKPTKIVGIYSAVRVYYDSPLDMKFSASETRAEKSVHLFNGMAKFDGFPSFSVAVGNDRRGFYRFEMEVGYIPLRTSKIASLVTNIVDNPGSNFDFSKNFTNIHILNLSSNHFLELPVFNDEYILFTGLGLGVGYAFPQNSDYLASNFMLPIAQVFAGVNFTCGNKSKISVMWRMLYADFNLASKMPFIDKTITANGGLHPFRSITEGGLDFQNLIVQGIAIEYMFYP